MNGGTPKAKTTSNFLDGERQGCCQIGRIAPNRLDGAGQPQEHQKAKIEAHDRRATRRELSDQSVSPERPVTRRQPRSHERPSNQNGVERSGECRSAMETPDHQEDN